MLKTREICSSGPRSDEVRIKSLMFLISFTKQEKQVCCWHCLFSCESVRVNHGICHSWFQLLPGKKEPQMKNCLYQADLWEYL